MHHDFHSYKDYQSGELIRNREKDAASMGNTLYLGSLKSEIYFCIYEKDYEQYVKMARRWMRRKRKTVLKYG